jgi:hypothetical protein
MGLLLLGGPLLLLVHPTVEQVSQLLGLLFCGAT